MILRKTKSICSFTTTNLSLTYSREEEGGWRRRNLVRQSDGICSTARPQSVYSRRLVGQHTWIQSQGPSLPSRDFMPGLHPRKTLRKFKVICEFDTIHSPRQSRTPFLPHSPASTGPNPRLRSQRTCKGAVRPFILPIWVVEQDVSQPPPPLLSLMPPTGASR